MKKSPLQNSVLNQIGDNGLLTYDDFCFLLTVLSTPTRYVETAFKIFDITGDGQLEAKEFEILTAKLSYNAGGFGSYQNTEQQRQNNVDRNKESGLMNYLFGKDRTRTVSKEAFFKFHKDLQDELIELEFREYDQGNTGRISEEDLGKFFLKHSNIPPKAKSRMLKRVKKEWPSKKRGVSLPSFRNLYQTLAGGEDLERAIYFMDEGHGLDYDQVRRVSHWVTTDDLSDHVARVIFVLLDDDQNGYLTKEELSNVLFSWRKARGFEKLGVNVTMGPKYPKKAGI
jgi:Ca2+-binding EF-hand superfamily protein